MLIAGLLLFAIAALLLVQARPKISWAVLILLAGCRLISFPLGRYQAEGHEATYLRFFENNQAIEVGNTALYPLMQVWWWLLGRLGLDLVPYAPLVLSSIMGAVAVLCLTDISRAQSKRQSGLFFLLWATQPILWLWSLSAYNVVFPFAFAAIAMWSMHKGRRALSIVCFLIAVLMRVELIMTLPLFWTVGEKRTFPLVVISGLLAILPLFWYEVPGSGEHWQSLQNNAGFWRPVLWFCPALLCAFLHQSARWLLLFVWIIGLLFIMSSFDDYGARHLLPLLLALALWLRFRARNIPQWLLVIAILAQSAMLINVRSRWFVGEEVFSQKLSQQHPELPRVSLSQARQSGCAWISEHSLFQSTSPRSHFNLYSKAEFLSLKTEHGCVDWCRDYNDFRWSTLSVMERAYRIDHLYESKAIAVVSNENSDCLQLRLERR